MSFRDFLNESKIDIFVKEGSNKDTYLIDKIISKEAKKDYEVGDEVPKSQFKVGKDGILGLNGYNVEVK